MQLSKNFSSQEKGGEMSCSLCSEMIPESLQQSGLWEGSRAKDACHKACQPQCHLQNAHSGRRKLTPMLSSHYHTHTSMSHACMQRRFYDFPPSCLCKLFPCSRPKLYSFIHLTRWNLVTFQPFHSLTFVALFLITHLSDFKRKRNCLCLYIRNWAWEMVQWLRVALLEDPGTTPSPHTVAHNHL